MYPCASSEDDWHHWLNGDCPEVVRVGTVHGTVSTILGCRERRVLGAKKYIQKLRYKHCIEAHEAMLVQQLLDEAAIVVMPQQPGSYQFLGAGGTDRRRYKLVVKLVTTHDQLWLSTLFRSDMATFKSALRRGEILREEGGR